MENFDKATLEGPPSCVVFSRCSDEPYWDENVPCLSNRDGDFCSYKEEIISESLTTKFEIRNLFLDISKFSSENPRSLLNDYFEKTKTYEEAFRNQETPFSSHHEILFGQNPDAMKLKRSYLKNLVVLSFCFMLVFSAFFSLRNLQTSVNSKYNLGLISLACMNAAFAIGCILANSIVQKVRPKRVIALMLVGNSLYVASNFYPMFITLVPSTLLLGFTMANLLVAQSTYLTSIAVSYASAANKRPDHIISAFNGYFLFMMYLAHFVGNLLSSTVFHLFSFHNINKTLDVFNLSNISIHQLDCGSSSILDVHKDNHNLNDNVFYVLLSIFMFITLQAHLIIAFFLDKLDVIFYKSKADLKSQLSEMWRLHLDPKMKFMLPLMAYLGFQEAFIYADFTNSYITSSIGLHMVGYAMMAFSAMDSISSFLCGYLRRFLAQFYMAAFGTILNVATLLFLYFWKPSPDERVIIFIVSASLGVADGIWQTLTNSLCGILFNSRQRVAVFSSLRMYQALGFTIASTYSYFLCDDIKVLIIIALLAVASFSFVGLEVRTSKTLNSQEYLGKDLTPSSIKISTN